MYVVVYNEIGALSKKSTTKLAKCVRIIVLGSGFAGIEVLRKLQKTFTRDKEIEIILVSKDNFLLFTPMLPEVSTGMVETRHILTPVRSFCKKAIFYQAEVESIDLERRKVHLKYSIGNNSQPVAFRAQQVDYDYLIIALGSETNFFGIPDIENHSFTMKDIDDAITLRNHVIIVLEQANLEHENEQLCAALLTFIVVGGGFNGIETVGALNDYVRGTIKNYYHNINPTLVRIVLVEAGKKILDQVDEDLGEYALKRLEAKGVNCMLNTQVKMVTTESIVLNDNNSIPSYSIIWTAGVIPGKLIVNLKCEHDKGQRIVTNNFLEIPGHEGVVYATGDCASITDAKTGKTYPPTAQHAIAQGRVAANNVIYEIKRKGQKKKQIDYKSKGMMAEIGKRDGIASLYGIKLHGFLAWWMWRSFYIGNLPTRSKRLKVLLDWTMDLFFKPDVSYFSYPQRLGKSRRSEKS
jgi:NADH:quinone reductase (non-electrogenic)